MHPLVYRPLIGSCSYSIRSSCLSRFAGAARLLSTREHPRLDHVLLDLQSLDRKWQKSWETTGKALAKEGAEKAYILAMFPYPSGALHMGHLRVYTIADVLARFKRMQGYRVLYPMAWDAFGLPAENAAMERGSHPEEWTKRNITNMKEQLKGMNGDFDWSREFMTCDPTFYKHTQQIFLLLYEHGLAYQADSIVNYDPVDQTVLANEQVDANGFSWRSGAKVKKIQLKQWFLRITAFQESLLEDLELLQQWPERVIAMQRNWLGRSKGGRIKFDTTVTGTHPIQDPVSVFTTRPDTLFGAQFLAVSASHPLVAYLSNHDKDLQVFLEALPALPSDSKIGYQLQGVTARNPLAQLSNMPVSISEPLPIYVAPYVVDGYGEGAVMGVPGHDSRDSDFWKTNRGDDPIRRVVISETEPSREATLGLDEAFTSPGKLASCCGRYAGFTSQEAGDLILVDLQRNGAYAEASETWKLRDWLISRQRYWGTPIPIIHCDDCGAVPVPVEELPVELPKVDGIAFRKRRGNPLEHTGDWLNVSCPQCSRAAKRDTDTMDTFACSSWYMFRFTDPHNSQEPFSSAKADADMPVDIYVGGIEHAILHLLYARFISKFLSTTPLWPGGYAPDIRGEPFKQQISQGMVHGKTYSNPETGKFLKPEELDLSDPTQPRIVDSDVKPKVTFEKMSKSKYNGVDPSGFIARYGADATRAHVLFQAPVTEVLEWEEERVIGVLRWLQRLHRFVLATSKALNNGGPTDRSNITSANASKNLSYPEFDLQALTLAELDLYVATYRTVASVTNALSVTLALNTCISDLMILTNILTAQSNDALSAPFLYHVTSTIIRVSAPFTPAFAEECWEILHAGAGISYPVPANIPTQAHIQATGHSSVFTHAWPTAPEEAVLQALVGQRKQTCAIMDNGKLRLTVEILLVPEGLEAADAERWVLTQIEVSEEGQRWLERKRGTGGWKRIVVVRRGRTVNFVG